MKLRTLLLFILISLTASGAYSQSYYFPGRIIIKYKTDAQLRMIRAQTQGYPKAKVQQILRDVQATNINPVWRFGIASQVMANNPVKARSAINELRRIYQISYSGNADPVILAAKISRYPAVEYAEPLYLRKTSFTPNDSADNPYPAFHSFRQAWEVTKGSSDVIIGIIDTGVNYLHEDLDAKLWVNTDEVPASARAQADQNSDGVISSSEVLEYLQQQNGDYDGNGTITLEDALAPNSPFMDGSDTDGNGFTDDIYGYDFWQSGGTQGQPVVSDNNPIIGASDHGTHVAGIAAAETNNGIGLAGAGFNVRYMAVKTGGIPDDPSTPDTDESRLIGFGFQGIIYAAVEGAQVINCSFGGGSFSAFESDVINFATDMGAVVVASSGNESADEVSFPSGYENVLSAGSVETNNTVASYSNTGYSLDVLATGSSILSTVDGNAYEHKTGTSMAAPVVSGLAGLIASIHPDWTARRVASQIRVTSTMLATTGLPVLGHGKINAFRAVSTNKPGLWVLSREFVNTDGNKLGINEDGMVNITLINYGDAVSSVLLTLESLNEGGVVIQQETKNISALATDETTTVSYSLKIGENYDLQQIPAFKLSFANTARNYRDFDIIEYDDLLFDVMNANNIKMSFGSLGTIGFTHALRGTGGVGFVPKPPSGNFEEGNNLLFGGGLILSANGQIFDAVRGNGNGITKDFLPQQIYRVSNETAAATQSGAATFTFGSIDGATSGAITLKTYAFSELNRSQVIYVEYQITNTSAAPLKNVYVGLYNDWDLGNIVSNNSAKYNAADSLLYITDENPESELPYTAVAHLGVASGLLAVNNRGGDFIDISNGFSDMEKLQALKAGKEQTEITGADVSMVAATGPFTVNPRATLTAGFIYAYGDDLNELREQVEYARQNVPFIVSLPGLISAVIPETTELYANYPNPFTDRTTIQLDLDKAADVKLTVFDVLGRRIKILRDARLNAGRYFITFNPDGLSSGVYYIQLVTDRKVETIPVTYIK